MRLETLLPLGKTDPGLRAPETQLDLARVGDDARLIEEIGYDGLVIEETKDDPYVVLALAAAATTRLKIGTAVAMAFPRSPTTTAISAWSLQKLSGGRFTLGLGSQVRGHIERRYGLKWSPAGPWMRDYVGAVRAVWECWQNGTRLDYESAHYNLNLMVPLFDPGPIPHPEIPIHLAAVNSVMCQVAGEVADGLRPHPVCTPKYIAETMLPAVRTGAAKGGRELRNFRVAMKFLFATAADEAGLQAKIRDIRARVAFYASTPAYRPAFAAHGLEALADELKVLSKAQRWEEMPGLISDEVLNTYAVIGTYDEIAQKIVDRYGAVATDVEFSIPISGEADKEIMADLAATLRAAPQPKLVSVN